MTQQELSKAKDKDITTSLAAMQRAAASARKQAIQTDTAIVVFRNHKIVRLTAAEIQHKDAA
ncbi:MAG: hypothetical protein ABIR84_09380 [Candidatus Nitrotoga sp.]